VRKMLLAVLTVTLLAGANRAGDVPAQAANGPGAVTRVIKNVQLVTLRLKGIVLASFIRTGMPAEQVTQILGEPRFWVMGRRSSFLLYTNLGLGVYLSLDATCDLPADCVIGVSFTDVRP
jgi:hypothetical protein